MPDCDETWNCNMIDLLLGDETSREKRVESSDMTNDFWRRKRCDNEDAERERSEKKKNKETG